MSKKLISVEQSGGITHKTYAHVGDDGQKKVTVASSQDTEGHMRRAKMLKQQSNGKSDFRFKATLPGNLINDAVYKAAPVWGVSPREAMAELVSGKTDRAQALLKTLTEGRDFRKFQAKNY